VGVQTTLRVGKFQGQELFLFSKSSRRAPGLTGGGGAGHLLSGHRSYFSKVTGLWSRSRKEF
jgi:hypothetical protein